MLAQDRQPGRRTWPDVPGRSRSSRPRLPRIRARFLALAAIGLVCLLYYKPVRSYLTAQSQLAQREAQVEALRTANRALERRVARAASGDELLRQARRLGLVRPGERLFIVNGIASWRRAQERNRIRER